MKGSERGAHGTIEEVSKHEERTRTRRDGKKEETKTGWSVGREWKNRENGRTGQGGGGRRGENKELLIEFHITRPLMKPSLPSLDSCPWKFRLQKLESTNTVRSVMDLAVRGGHRTTEQEHDEGHTPSSFCFPLK